METRPLLVVLALLTVLLPGLSARAAFDPADPLGSERLVVDSEEVVVTTAYGTNLRSQVLDTPGDVAVDGLVEQYSVPASGFRGSYFDFDTAVADFDGDGEPELATAWERSDGRVAVQLSELGPDGAGAAGPLYVSENLVAGSPHERQIRLLAGQLDADPARELILVYRDASGIFAEYLNASGLTASRFTDLRWNDPTSCNDGSPVWPQTIHNTPYRRFDVALGDVDGDGRDDLTYARIAEDCTVSGGTVVSVRSRVEVRVRDKFGWTSKVVWDVSQSPYYDFRAEHVALAMGDFDGQGEGENGGKTDEIAVMIQAIYDNGSGATSQWTRAAILDYASRSLSFGPQGIPFIQMVPTAGDERLDLAAYDFDFDGVCELVALTGRQLALFDVSPSGIGDARSPNAIVNTGPAVQNPQLGLGRIGIADVDGDGSGDFAREILVDDQSAGLRVFRVSTPRSASGDWALAPAGDFPLTRSWDAPFAVATADLDHDGLYLGTPTVERRAGVVQPLVVLNAPPVHFDVFDDGAGGHTSYDVNECFGVGSVCDHEATYLQSTTQTEAVSTEIGSTWSVASDVTATAGYEGGVFGASVEASLSQEVGANFSFENAQTQTVTVTQSTTANSEGRFYATVMDYDVIEYPIYEQSDLTTPLSHVVAVVPDLSTLSHDWFDMTTALGFEMASNHAPTNALSYGERVSNQAVRLELPIGAVGGNLRNLLSDNGNTVDFTLEFGSLSSAEATQGSHQSVGYSVEAEVHGGFAGFTGSLGASTAGRYASEAIQTHRTTLGQDTQVSIHLGAVDGTILADGQMAGSAEYWVEPYVYWRTDGALVVDYEVEVGTAAFAGPWWDALYGSAPDLAFALPMLHDAEKGYNTAPDFFWRTRDLAVDPRRPAAGQPVTLQAMVRNDSLVDAPAATLSFYLEDPREGGTWIGDAAVPALGAREETVVEYSGWSVPAGLAGDPKPRIYAWLDVDGAVDEIHEDNNLGWIEVDVASGSACADGIDNDGDGLVDVGADPGCTDFADSSEREGGLACDDGIDQDGDGLADFPDDPGCRDAFSASESPQCDDGVDNDGDGLVDAADPQCAGGAWRDREAAAGRACGLGSEGALIAALLYCWRRRRAR
jgi:hypothetical protein